MPTVKAGNIAKGLYLNFKGTPHLVTKSEFHSPGKGSAFCKVKMKNIKTGASLDFTYKSNEQIEYYDLNSQEMQFLYMSGDQAVFMNPQTYEQVELDIKLMDGKEGFLTSDIKIYVLFQEDKALGVTFPPKVKMKVKVAEEATAGNRVNAPKKPVTLETGLEVYAPLFIKPGDVIMIDTDTFDYVSRAND
jgi:elongation factor P